MILRINGEEKDVVKCDNLLELINAKRLKAGRIVVEHNRRIVFKEQWHEIILSEKDNIEIVSFVGGG